MIIVKTKTDWTTRDIQWRIYNKIVCENNTHILSVEHINNKHSDTIIMVFLYQMIKCYDSRTKYLHNPIAPAIITYHENGKIHWEEWYNHGDRHRKDGPALICYSFSGEILSEDYYYNGVIYSKEELLKKRK